MARPPETLVEIPPPEAPVAVPRWWGLALLSVASVGALVVLLTITQPRRPSIEWARQTGPPESVNLDSLVSTTDAFALLSGMTVDGVLLWSSSDGDTWRPQPLSGAPSQLVAIGDRLIAHNVGNGRVVAPGRQGWEESETLAFPDEIRSRQGSGRSGLVGSGDSLVAMSIGGDVWWSRPGTAFELAVAEPDWGRGSVVDLAFDSDCSPPTRTSPDVPPLVQADSELVAMISSNPDEPFGIWPVCEPRLWFSDNGRLWTESDSTIGGDAYVYSMAWRAGRFTAVGGFGIGEPAVWTSETGREWDLVPAFEALDGIDLYTVEAGPAAWVILGRDSQELGSVGWTSLDGRCWTPLPFEISGSDAAVSSEQIVIFDRTTFPDIWVGTTTGGSGSC